MSGSHGGQRSGADDGRRRCAACSTVLAADNTARLCGRCFRDHYDQLREPPVYGDEFWTTDDFRAAFESQHIGRVLKAYRHHPQHLQLLGKALNQELLGRWLRLTQPKVSNLEKGKPEKNQDVLTAYAQILHIPQRMLWFDLPGQTRIAAREEIAKERAEAILLAVPSPTLQLPNSVDRISSTTVDDDPITRVQRLLDARSHFERMYRNSGGVVVGTRIELFLFRRALPITASLDATDEVERKSKRAIGGLIALAGVCAYDSEDWISANSYFNQAVTIAEMSHDYGFHAYVVALMANQALALEDYKAAETLANIGLRSSVKVSAAPLTIDLQMMRVKALAAMGDGSAAMAVIHTLETEIGKLPTDSGIAEASYAQAGHLHALLAEALTSLGDLKAAQRFAEQSLLSETHAKGKVNRLASMATLEIARGEMERASLLACEMVDNAQGMESRRLGSRFSKLRAALADRPSTASHEALNRIDTAISLMP
jgi:hypothetical protein